MSLLDLLAGIALIILIACALLAFCVLVIILFKINKE